MIGAHRVLIVDDEGYICDIIAEMFANDTNYAVVTETDPHKAIEILRSHQFDLVLTDLVMGDCSGMQIMELALATNPETVVVLMTGHPTVENAIAAVKFGAYDYLVKPFKLELLKTTIERGLRKQQLARENIHLKEQLALYKIAEAMGTTINLDKALNQVLRLSVKEFSAAAASILFYETEPEPSFAMKALHMLDEEDCDSDFLEGRTGHSLMAVESKDIEIENVYLEAEDNTDPFAQVQVKSFLSCALMVSGNVIGVLNLQRQSGRHEFTTGELQSLKIIASKAAYAIANSKLYDDLQNAYLATISAFANAVEARDHYTRGHTERVTYLSEMIARELGWSDDRLYTVSMGGLLHDIGKVGVPDSVLNKPGPLTEAERGLMQQHTEIGARMIAGIPFLKSCLPFIVSHHERWDGAGYPAGLKAAEIPIEGRILAVADTFDAILTNRPYREAGTLKHAVEELQRFAGIQFDPGIVDIFLRLLKRNREKIETLYADAARTKAPKTALV
jgi:putative nucleotidyltransferase with HDIG domain